MKLGSMLFALMLLVQGTEMTNIYYLVREMLYSNVSSSIAIVYVEEKC